jgi:hypothetical protein
MSQTFRFNDDAVLKHLNIRKEGDDEKVLKVDLKVESNTDMVVPDYLDTGLRSFLWSPQGIVRNPMVKAISYEGEVASCIAEAEGLIFTGVTVHKFKVEPLDSFRAKVTMTLTFEPSKSDVAILAERFAEGVKLSITSQPSLLDDDAAAGAGTASAPAPTGEEPDPLLEQARTVIVTEKRASISLVQRHLRIGYNRAARLLEALEKSGVVSAMSNDGHRKVVVEA